MRKSLVAAAGAFLLLILPCSAQSISDIDITARLREDGSARITQVWSVYTTEGTEWYVPVGNLDKMDIEDLSVSEGGNSFISEGYGWNVNRSISEKAGRCGIVRTGSKSVELCWGIGSYGSHQWTVSFTVKGLVQSLSDADAFNFMFINPGLSSPPQHAKLTIFNATGGPEWTYDNTRVWGFGFYGDINVVDGTIVAESSEPFEYRSSMIAMVSFNKGMFTPSVSRDMGFDEMKARALEESSYSDSDKAAKRFFAMLLGFFALILGGLLYIDIETARGRIYKKSVYGSAKIDSYFREAPFSKSLPAAWYTLQSGGRFNPEGKMSDLVSAFFLKWILEGGLTVTPDPRNSKRVNLGFKDGYVSEDEAERSLYGMAFEASGANHVLESGEFEKWSGEHVSRINAWPSRVKIAGGRWMREKGYLSGSSFTEAGQKEATNLIGFKNFLKDFTLSKEREAVEVGLWKDYLVYAGLFGIADKVAKQFQKLYPVEFKEYTQSIGMDVPNLMRSINYTSNMSTSMVNRVANHTTGSIGGFGGGTSFGGGGGFSGGGFGGGAR